MSADTQTVLDSFYYNHKYIQEAEAEVIEEIPEITNPILNLEVL